MRTFTSTGSRHGSPRAGFSLAGAVESKGAPVRQAVAALARGFSERELQNVLPQVFPRRTGEDRTERQLGSSQIRAAWHLVSMWLTARVCHKSPVSLGLSEAEAWFVGADRGKCPSLSSITTSMGLWEAEELLSGIFYNAEFQNLLPYILEEHGPGSRQSVMKKPSTAVARAAKKESGVYYTPTDVADYMVGHVCRLYAGNIATARVIDPACGTAVFLLAMLRAVSARSTAAFSRFDYVVSCLHGVDISAHALDAAAFLLLRECLGDVVTAGLSPRAAWSAIRNNLVEADSLCIESLGFSRQQGPVSSTPQTQPLCLKGLFPRLKDGFDILVGNPPYAALGERSDFSALAARFACLRNTKPSSRTNLYPFFIEMMWQFTAQKSNAAALVTPLSIAFHRGGEYGDCRRAMSQNGGRWQFAFFDREPHALFGEEVKTRNAILFRVEVPDTPTRGQPAEIETGPLRKWTSRTRDSLFQRIDFTPLDSMDITPGIPKLCGDSQSRAFLCLQRQPGRFRSLALRIGTCVPSDTFTNPAMPRVFVGGTGYNFLNVFCPSDLPSDEIDLPLSDSSVHCLDFQTDTEAHAAFSILSSQLVFWLWRVLGDGFHVPGWFFDAIPFERGSFSQSDFELLATTGEKLWRSLQSHRFVSLNRGKRTVGFRALACQEERNVIDAALTRAAGLDAEFSAELRRFVHENAVVDPTDSRRNHISRHFTERSI